MSRAIPLLVAGLVLTCIGPAAANFPQHVDATVQPGGTISETSSKIPKDAESGTIAVKPKASDTGDYFAGVKPVFATYTKKQRVLFCVGLYQELTAAFGDEVEFEETAPEFRILVLAACLELAFQNEQTNARAAATSCPAVPISVPMNISRTSGGHKITVDGTVKKVARPALRVRCRRVKGTMRIKLRPRNRTRSLRSVVGKKLAIGFYNTADRPVSMRTTFNVK